MTAIQTLPTPSETLEVPCLHIAFPVQGTHLPADHGYVLYAAITSIVLAPVQHRLCQRLAASMESSLGPKANTAMRIQCSTPCGINGRLSCEQYQHRLPT